MNREIICNGLKYTAGTIRPFAPSYLKGFGGRHFTILFSDGLEIRTDDLVWDYSGKNRGIPDTAQIFSGWGENKSESPCDWQPSGGMQVFQPKQFSGVDGGEGLIPQK